MCRYQCYLRKEAKVKTTCLINNFNYRRYVGEAIDSALAQTVALDEIVVVDDGSTDGSSAWLKATYGSCPAVTIVEQRNQGQLACFNEGFRHATGDVVFFLDADDVYERNYVEQALRVYEREPSIGFVFSGFRHFGERAGKQPRPHGDADLGFSVIATLVLRAWVGGPTSCLSMRRWVLEKLMPLPDTEAWGTRADDCLIFGSSLAGARKYRLGAPLVKYRLHGSNHFAGRREDTGKYYGRRLAVNRLFKHFVQQLGYDADTLPELAHREFQTIPAPTFRQLRDYLRLVFISRLRFSRKLALMGSILGRYLRPGKGHGEDRQVECRMTKYPMTKECLTSNDEGAVLQERRTPKRSSASRVDFVEHR
jgi:glycosyltransferase involved in cell wall biosynthesis